MAKNRKDLDKEDLELGVIDLDKIDDEFEVDDTPKTGPVRRFAAEFKRGFLEQTKARVLMKNFLRASLPDGYSRLWALGESVRGESGQMVDEIQREVGPELDNIAEQMEAQLPKIRNHTPERLYHRIETGVSRFREGQAYGLHNTPSAEQLQSDEDAARLAEAVERLTESTASEVRNDGLEVKERRLRDRLDQGRFDVLSHQLDRVATNLEYQVSYQDQVTYKFQRKSLEVQYRSFFALRDMRKYAEVAQKTHEQAYNALVHNTGLPDHLKQFKSERVRFGVQDSLTSALGDQIASSLPGYLATFYPEVRDRLKEKLVDGIRVGSEMASGASMAGNMGADGAGMAGGTVGGAAGSFVKDTLLSRAALAARPGMEKLSDKMGGRHHLVSYFLNNLPAMLQEYTQDYSQTGGLRGVIHSLVSSLAPSFFLDEQLKDSSFQTIDKQSAFNQLTQRSIVEIIPGYLSRLLHETRMMRTGRDDLDRETYDVTSGRFTGYREARDAMQNRIINETQRRNIDATLTQTVDTYDPDHYLSDDARAALRERLMRDAATNEYFKPERYAAGEGFSTDTDDDTLEELRNFFRAQFDFDDDGKLVKDAENNRRMNAFSDAFLEVRNAVPDPKVELQRLASTGIQEVLHDLGLITSDYGQTRVNYEKVWDLYRTEHTGSQTPRKVAASGEIPRTHINPSYDEEDNRSFREHISSIREDIKEKFRFNKTELKLPKMTDPLVARLPELDNEVLAKIALWDDRLYERIKRVDPEIELRLSPYIDRLQKKTPEVKLDRSMVDAIWTLVEPAQQTSQEPSDTSVPPEGSTEEPRQRWQREASRRAEATRQSVSESYSAGPTRPNLRDVIPPIMETPGGEQPTAGIHRRPSEYQTYLEEIKSLQRQQLDQSGDFITRLVGEMERGFKIREIPAMLIRDGSDPEGVQAGQGNDGNTEEAKDGWWNAFKAGGRAAKSSAKRWGSTLKSGATVTGRIYTDLLSGAGKGVGGLMEGAGKGVGSVLAGFGYQAGKFIRDPTPDIYLKGRPDEPVLLSRDLDRKRYIDTKTNKVIKSVSDIQGEVWDTHEERIAITASEVAEGLYDKRGKSIARQAAESVIDFYKNVYLKPSAMALRQLPKLGNLAKDVLLPKRDAYYPGEAKPRIRANLMEKNFYFDQETQEPIHSYSDISGTVVDRQGNVVVDETEIPELIGRDGRPLESLGTKLGSVGRRIAKLPMKMVGAGLRGAKTVAKGAWDLGTTVSKQVLGLMGRVTGFKYDPSGGMGNDKKVVPILEDIYNLLLERLPENKTHRRGSWQEEFAERAREAEEEKDFKEEQEWRKDGPMGSISKRLGAVLAAFQSRDETLDDIAENTEDMDSGTDIWASGGDGGGDESKRPRRRPKPPKKPVPKGFWNKLKHFGGKGIRSVGRGAKSIGKGALTLAGLGGLSGKLGRGANAVGRGAMWAGRGLLSGGGMIARLAMPAATAIAGVLSAPVIAGAAAATVVGVGGWYWWQGKKAADGPFRQLRYTQYGFEPSGFNREAKKLHAMEVILEKAVVRNEGEAPTFDVSDLDADAFIEAMGVDRDSQEQLYALGAWLENRAKPIYLAYQKALADYAPNVSLLEMDDKLDKDVGLDVLETVTFPYSGETPYQYTVNPFDYEEPIEVTEEEIRQKEKAVREVYDGTREARKRNRDVSAAAGSTASITASVNQAMSDAKRRGAGRPDPTSSHPDLSIIGGPGLTSALSLTGGSTVLQAAQRSQMPNYRKLPTGRLTALQAIRIRAYGLVDLQRVRVIGLLDLEDTLHPYLSFDNDGKASFGGDVRILFRAVASTLGLSLRGSSTDDETSDRDKFILWFKGRFLPAYLSFASAVNQMAETSTVANGERALSPTQKVGVGNAIMAATYTEREDVVSVWDVMHLIYDDPNIDNARMFAQQDLDLLRHQAQADQATTPSQAASESESSSNEVTSGSLSAIAAAAADAVARGQTADGRRNATRRGQSHGSYRHPGRGGGYASPRTRGGLTGPRGNTFSGIVEGNGGVWEEVPMPQRNKDKDAAMPTLLAVQEMTGVDANLLATFASIESAFNYTIKAPTSSATGWFQFINATWDGMIERHADKYGIPHQGKSTNAVREMRKDPRINALMGAEFLKGNYQYLENKLGRKPTDTDLYLAHFFGAGTAYKFLQSDQNASAPRLFSSQAASNRSIFYKSGGRARTIGEVYAVMDEKVSHHRFGGGTNVNRTAANDEPDPIAVEEGSSQSHGVVDVGGVEMMQLGPSGGGGGDHLVDVDTQAPSANDGGTSSRRRSLNERASATVNPYGSSAGGAPTTPTPTTPRPEDPSGGGTGDSTTMEDPVVVQRERQREQAAMADRRQRHQTEESRAATNQMGRLLNQQLEVQQTMSDYLKEIAESLTSDSTARPSSEAESTSTRNDTSRPPERPRQERTQHRRAPVSMTR